MCNTISTKIQKLISILHNYALFISWKPLVLNFFIYQEGKFNVHKEGVGLVSLDET